MSLNGDPLRDKPIAAPRSAAELVRLKVDIIVTAGGPANRAAKEATATIPIVMIQGGDAVGSGLVASLARPGGNITGLATLRPELSGKRLELLKEIVPRSPRVAVFVNSTSQDYAQVLEELDLAAGALGVKLHYLDILSPKDVETALRAAGKGRSYGALFRVPGQITQFSATTDCRTRGKEPAPGDIRRGAEEVEAGGLMSYGVSFTDLDRRAATYVDKILKGAKACRPSRGAAKEVRVNHQSQSS